MDSFLTASLGAPAGAVIADWTRSFGANLDHPLAAGRVVLLDEEGNDTRVVIGELLDLLASGRDTLG